MDSCFCTSLPVRLCNLNRSEYRMLTVIYLWLKMSFFARFEQGYCYLRQNCTFAHGQEECDYWEALYYKQAAHLTQLEEKQLLKEGFSETVRRRIKQKEPNRVVSLNYHTRVINYNC